MATDRQYVVEVLDAQTVQIRSGAQIVGTLSLAGSRLTGSTPGTAASIVTWLGNGQSGTVGQNLTVPPAVRVLDASGVGVPGSTVTWFHGGGSGTTSTGTVTTTDSNGVSTVGSWSLGTTVSTYTLFAYSDNLTNQPIRFSATAVAGSAFSISASGGTSQTTVAAGTYPVALQVLVHDQYGNPVSGATGLFSSTDANGSFSASTFTANSSGVTSAVYTTGQAVSTQSVFATLPSGTSARFAMTITPTTPTLSITAGQDQVSNSDTSLPTRPTVIVQDGFNNVWTSGQTLQYVVVTGSGTVSSATSHTGSGGTSEVDWKLGAGTGLHQLEVSLLGQSGSTVTFNASATNPTADTIAVYGGTGQSATVNSATAATMEWIVTGGGSAAVGQVVDLAITPSGSLSASQVASSSTGIVRVTPTLGTVVSVYTVTASAPGLTGSPIAITATATAGSASSLTFYTRPSSTAPAGEVFPAQPVIITTDVYGNQVASNDQVTASLIQGTGPLSADNLVVTASGVTATYAGMYVGATGSHIIAFDATSRSRCTSEVIADPPFADHLAFTTQPTGGVAGGTIGTVVVTVQDSNGATVTTATNTITLTLTTANNTEGATIGGTVTAAAVAGVASFTPTVDLAGSYTLDATSTGLPTPTVTSTAFTMASTAYPNLPAGYTEFVHALCNVAPSTAYGAVSGWVGSHQCDGGTVSIVNDSTAPLSPTACWRTRYATTQSQSVAPVWYDSWTGTESNPTEFSEIYFSQRIMIGTTSGFWNHPVGTKLGFFGYGQAASGSRNQMYLLMKGTGSAPGALQTSAQLQLVQQNHVSATRTCTGGTILTTGVWHHLEIVLKIDSAVGAGDGEIHVWLNGTKRMTVTNATFRTSGNTKKFYWYRWNPTWGGVTTGASHAGHTDDILIDDYSIYGLA